MTTTPKLSTLPEYQFLTVGDAYGDHAFKTSSVPKTDSRSDDYATAYDADGIHPVNVTVADPAGVPNDLYIKAQNAVGTNANRGANILLEPGVGTGGNVSGVVTIVDTGNAAGWNKAHLVMGTYHLWVSATGKLYIKNGAPTTDTDGTVVGTQT